MEQKHRTILRLHWSSIRDNLEPKNILPKLVTVLIETDKEDIKAQSTRQESCDKLLEILLRRGPTAFEVFVEALKQTVPHLAVDLIEADKKTEDELIDPRKQSARLIAGICKLKTELETEKQNRIRTLQGLKKMKTLHGKGNETKEEEITPDGLQKKEATTESLTQKEQDETRQKENFKEEDERLLQKRDYLDEENKQEKQSENLEAAKEEQEKIKQLQRENKQLKEKVTEKTFGFEKILAREQQMKKKLKDSLEKCQAQTKDKDVLLKKMRLENKRLHEQSNAEKSKCDALSEEVRRLKEISGHVSYNCPRCEGLRKERDSTKEENESLRKKNEELENKIQRISEEKEKFACEKAGKQMKATRKTTNTLVTKPTIGLQAQVNDLENTVKEQRKQMSDLEKSSSDAIEKEKSKCDSLEEKIRGLKLRLTETIRPGRLHIYSGKDFDKHGVVYALQNEGITATRSSGKKGQAKDILKNEVKDKLVCSTKPVEDSWWCVDLTENYALYLTHYTLRHGQELKTSFLYNWQLEGSVDECKWTVLKEHTNDRGLITFKPNEPNHRYNTKTWAIDGELKAFRYFKILQTGFNSSDRFGIFLSGIELYGVLVKIGS